MASTKEVSEVAGVKRMISPSGSTWWGGCISVNSVDVGDIDILKLEKRAVRSRNQIRIYLGMSWEGVNKIDRWIIESTFYSEFTALE
jgi:hypothetical protein